MKRTLREKQSAFVWCVRNLLGEAERLGYEATFGEAWRSPETARIMADKNRGISNSLHIDRLAIDINLFRDGVWLRNTEDHAELGAYWKTLDPDARWGGDFSRPDGNHYSLTHGGRS